MPNDMKDLTMLGMNPGSTGCQPVAFGRWPNALQRNDVMWRKLFAASCRELQASGLCSPELALSAAVLDNPAQIFGQPARNWYEDDFRNFVGMQ